MSSNPIISVESLGKSYRINHQVEGRRYVALRDVITEKAQNLAFWNQRRIPDNVTSEEFWALKDVSFEVNEGEVIGVIGRNGAGKSTLLKILSRITEPSKGRVQMKGRVASLLEVGTGFHPELTGRENVYLNGAILGMSRVEIRRKFDEIVAFAEVERFLDTPVKRYSSGMYVRLAFAVAAHLEPEILIVDEVLAVGDMDFQKKCLGKMEDVSRGGRTILLVSHNMEAISRMCSKCILLSSGQVEFDGSPLEAISQYHQKKTDQDAVVNLLTAERKWSPRRHIEFTKIWMQGCDNWIIPYGKNLGWMIGIKFNMPADYFEIAIAIFTATGVEICSNIIPHKVNLERAEIREGVISAELPELRLVPGRYSMLLSSHSESGGEDFIPRACEFEVMTSEEAARERADSMNSIIIPRIQTDWVKLDA